ncbi:hypothetical protein FQZ97_840900 [compost metagenome]
MPCKGQRQQDQRQTQPDQPGRQRALAPGLGRIGEQQHVPAEPLQRPALHEIAAVIGNPQARHRVRCAPLLRAQRLGGDVAVLPGLAQLAQHGVGQRVQAAVAPVAPGSEKHHTRFVGQRQRQAGFAPAVFKRGQVHLDRDHALYAVAVEQRGGDEDTRFTGGHAHAVEQTGPAFQGLPEVGPETVVAAHEAGRRVPVARGQGVAAGVHEVDRGHAGALLGEVQVAVGFGQTRGVVGRAQHLRQGLLGADQVRQVLELLHRTQQIAGLQLHLGLAQAFGFPQRRPVEPCVGEPHGQGQHEAGPDQPGGGAVPQGAELHGTVQKNGPG